MKRILTSKVAGVTYDNRQDVISRLHGDEPCRIVPEPDNKYDPNALAVHIAFEKQVCHVGYIPRELAQEIAPYLEGESIMVRIIEITGGFQTFSGGIASYGLLIQIELPDRKEVV